MELFRPVGIKELELIWNLKFKAFPPRLEIQPIFYPVLNEEYAVQIAKEWNTRDAASGFVGYVTRFEVDDDYVSKFERKIVGARVHEELWVPSEELEEFNSHIIGNIEVIRAFHSLEYIKICDPSLTDEDLNRYSLLDWHHLEYVKCHIHCQFCDAQICSDHSAATGDDYTHGYANFENGKYCYYLCPPCYTCLIESVETT
jgi:hypothetical protein